ncbi:MAG: T9SS type A sorting domain-containing protein [Bacteroidetes bacterium]|nr:T9SS type A sorting domain-containing protein [Bacteroidota bacterium]
MRTLLLLLTFSIIAISETVACSISTAQQYFCQVAGYTNHGIIRGKITDKINKGIKIKVYEVYRGPATESVITVWDNQDWDCNGIIFNGEATNMGNVGETVVVFISQISQPENNWEKAGDYRNVYSYINDFPQHHYNLVQKGDKIKGPFSEGNWSVPLDKLAETLRECVGGMIHETPIVINGYSELQVYPNPVREYLFISGSGESADVKIYNLSGQLVAKKVIFIAEEGINIQNLTDGVYICMAEIDGIISRKKFMVMKN